MAATPSGLRINDSNRKSFVKKEGTPQPVVGGFVAFGRTLVCLLDQVEGAKGPADVQQRIVITCHGTAGRKGLAGALGASLQRPV